METDAQLSSDSNVRPHLVWTGVLDAFFETGTEGVLWSVLEVPSKGYESLHVLQDGDELTVYRSDGSIRWSGIVELEYETGYRSYPKNPEHGQQCVFGYWVHGNQRGMDLKVWAAMFFGLPDNLTDDGNESELSLVGAVRVPPAARVLRYVEAN